MKKSFKQKALLGKYLREILKYLAQGYYYKEIAKLLELTPYEMSCCIKILYGKYHARNKINLVAKAIKAGDIFYNKN